MTVVKPGTTASWIGEINTSHTTTITFEELVEIANKGWNWLRTQPNAWTEGGKNCLVSALWVPGGKVYIGSIARGFPTDPASLWAQMKANGPTKAPVWWSMKTATGNHAEDNVIYQFESEQTRTGGTAGHGLMMATYGSFSGSKDTVGAPVNPCSKCKMTSDKLEINYFVKELVGLHTEPDVVAKRAELRAATPAGPTTLSTVTTSVISEPTFAEELAERFAGLTLEAN